LAGALAGAVLMLQILANSATGWAMGRALSGLCGVEVDGIGLAGAVRWC
jgi:hypothetical protein